MRSICKFCNKDLGEIYLSSDDEAPLTQGRPTSHECESCQVRYVYRRNGALYGYCFWTFYDGKKYCAHFYEKLQHSDEVIYIPGAFQLTQDGIKHIFWLDFHPDITPSNFAKKLPTLLIFS